MEHGLIERIQSLPPELFDQIKSNVLHHHLPEPGSDDFRYEHITAAYKHPLPLHLNRASRQEFAKRYYGSTILVFPSRKVFRRFVMAMENNHLLDVRGMRVSAYPEPPVPETGWESDFFGRSGANFCMLVVNLDCLMRIGEMLGCLGKKKSVLAVLRKEDVRSWKDRLSAQYH